MTAESSPVAKVLGVTGGAVAAVAAAGFVGYRLVERRRLAGNISIADSLARHSEWWKEQRRATGEILYVAVGDSAAQGIGASVPGRSYVGLLANHIRRTSGRTVRVINLSQSGARLREALSVQLPHVCAAEPDIVTVSIGANDMGSSFREDRFEAEVDRIYRELPAHSIVADIPSHYVGPKERNVRVANVIVRRVAERYNLFVAPLHAVTRRQSALWYVVNQVAADFFHPNDRGYRVWASAFSPQVDRRLAEL
ncbi:MAG: hydrolase family protein [Microbacteriaceae bacterium]|nr:hydrolase family protein [Microbacteriaceae bacterium]